MISKKLIQISGAAGALGLLFIAGVFYQVKGNWYADFSAGSAQLTSWIASLPENNPSSIVGIVFAILAITSFSIFTNTYFRITKNVHWANILGLSFHMVAVCTGFVVFTMGLGFTYALADLVQNGYGDKVNELVPVASVVMQGFTFGDEIASLFISCGALSYSIGAFKAKVLPVWICWVGFVSFAMVILAVFSHLIPALMIFQLGYPLLIFWFIFTGIYLYVKADKVLEIVGGH